MYSEKRVNIFLIISYYFLCQAFLKKLFSKICSYLTLKSSNLKSQANFFFCNFEILIKVREIEINTVFPLIGAPALIKFWNCEVQRLLEGGAN